MVRLNIELSEKLRSKVAARAIESGHETVEEYIASLILADADPAKDYGAPELLRVRSIDEVRSKLQEGINSGAATEMTAADWAEIRHRVRRRQ